MKDVGIPGTPDPSDGLDAIRGTSSNSPLGGSADPSHVKFGKFSLLLLAYTVLVVLFGAFVRASLSGDGCGTSWPFCHGSVLPIGAQTKTYIELTHRFTSGLVLFGTIALVVWSFRLFAKGHVIRKASVVALGTTLISSAIGALLVRAEWVVHDKSLGRAISMPIHLVNNFFLLASLALAGYWALGGALPGKNLKSSTARGIKWLAGGYFLLGMTGALSAMGKTAYLTELKAARTFLERITMHVGENAPPLLRGGLTHPILAMGVLALTAWVCYFAKQSLPQSQPVKQWANWVLGIYLFQMAFGVVNLVMSAPVAMQLAHLLLAVISWLALVMLWATVVGIKSEEDLGLLSRGEPVSLKKEDRSFAGMISDYVALTKPRVISLLLFTTLAAMFIAQGGAPNFWLCFWVMIGGYLAAGASNAFNMVIERDLDVAMERTSKRPTLNGHISARQALFFAFGSAIASFVILTFAANLLAAIMALCGLLCYVFVYTLWLKRRTWHNIVIGGAAGAFPPLVGYAAVKAELSPLAWFLFALIFTWTPVHFWALAILIKDDYAKAGVPMLPVVKGDQVTVIQIVLYTIITIVLCMIPLLQSQLGAIYYWGAGLLNLGLLVQSLMLFKKVERPQAKKLFKYSMAYLALIFVVIAVDRVVPLG
ncbi:MAG: heme o synthase [Fimbriimonadaceae bacterium]|jgi:protoheme IX farnesyltransferase|nr:heme o synthase [Fimbriimonadaceae bacterium]